MPAADLGAQGDRLRRKFFTLASSVLGEGRALFRVPDVVELAGLVARLVGREAQDGV